MASMVDRGDNYHVLYLGSSMLAQASTGLGVLQRPLRDLYYRYRQSGGGPAAQERYLQMSPRGLTMTFKETSSAQPTEHFYDMPSILFWDAVQFVAVRGSKKVMCAFEPLDNDHSRNKDNLFQVLDKKYQFLQQMTHPPLFACVLRRTAGVKALDMHCFVCSSDEEAMGLVRALNGAQRNYAADEVHESGVFGYRPFDHTVGAPGGDPPAENRNAGQPERPVAHVRSMRQLARAPPGGDAQKQPPRGGAGGFQLTQDLVLGGSRTDLSPDSIPSSDASPNSPGDHVYQYIGHIHDDTLPRNGSGSRTPESRVNAKSVFPGGVAASVAQRAKTKGLGQQEERSSPEGQSSLPRSERSQGSPAPFKKNERASVKEAVVRPVYAAPQKGPQRASKLGQGYSLLSGSGAPLPDTSSEYDSSEPGSPPTLPPRGLHSSSLQYDNSLPRDNSIPRPTLLPHYRDYDRQGSSWERRQQEPPRGFPREDFHPPQREDFRSPSREDVRHSPQGAHHDPFPPRREPEGRRFTPPGRAAENPPSRPVAKVPPHKVTGVQVLPLGPFPALKTADKTSPGDRPRSIVYYDDTMYSSKPNNGGLADPARRGKGPSPNNTADNRYDANWQFKPPKEGEYGYRPPSEQTKSDPAMNEKLLMNQKKDAEIASLMHNLQFEFDGKTMSPGMPAGNNFEKSLGYFP